MSKTKKIIIAVVILILIGGGIYLVKKSKNTNVKQIDINGNNSAGNSGPQNTGPVSPIAGVSCDDWNRRPFAVMQPADASTRPLSGLSDADMVVEMPAVYGSITRLMTVYVCGNPERIGSLRSSRHDYIPIAAGLDAIYVHWGGSHFALDKLKEGIIDNLNCNNDGGQSAGKYCYRETKEYLTQNKAFPNILVKSDDTGYLKFAEILQAAKDFGYSLENKFVGYPHQDDAAIDQRPLGGHLRIGYPEPFDEEFDYDKDSNSYLRSWGGVADLDKNNGKREAPKNIVIMIAEGAQMESQYANFQVGDPWYDESDSGAASFYMNGKETTGTWKKDKSKLDSKLTFYNPDGSEVKFVPGQIWVSIIDPGIGRQWTPGL